MSIRVVGCSHHETPIEIREQLALPADRLREALDRWRERYPEVELVVLSTCNRVELYAADEESPVPSRDDLVRFLIDFHAISLEKFAPHFYDYHDEEAVRHLLAVASSLESMVVGEPQILAQVKQAYQTATEAETTGPILHATMQTALKVARQIAGQTGLHRHRVSIPSVAVADFAGQIFEQFDDKRTAVLGAGEMAEETLRYLADAGAQDFTILNRSEEKAARLACCFEAKTRPWSELAQVLAEADLLITATGATEPVVTAALFAQVESARRGRPLFILDLAVPRDVEPELAQFAEVYLYSIDDLKTACQRNRQARDQELPAARRIVEEETEQFMTELRHRVTGPVIRRLRGRWHEPKEDELRRLFNKLPDLDDATQAEIRQAFDRLINKLLHPPMESLRDESRKGPPSGLIEALSKLFKLKE